MQVVPLTEGLFSVDKQKNFRVLDPNNKDIKMAVTPFLIRNEAENILIDAGYGWIENESPKIVENLEKLKLKTTDITKVLLSHLHKDHIDGLIDKSSDDLTLLFPSAEIYIQKREYDFALQQKESHSFDLEILDFIINHSKIIFLDDDFGQITDFISFEVVGGHTPFLQVFWIKHQSEIYFFGSDNLPQENYLHYSIAYKSDFDGKSAMSNRQIWLEKAKNQHWKILLYHDLETPILTL